MFFIVSTKFIFGAFNTPQMDTHSTAGPELLLYPHGDNACSGTPDMGHVPSHLARTPPRNEPITEYKRSRALGPKHQMALFYFPHCARATSLNFSCVLIMHIPAVFSNYTLTHVSYWPQTKLGLSARAIDQLNNITVSRGKAVLFFFH